MVFILILALFARVFLPIVQAEELLHQPRLLAMHTFSLEDRYPVPSVSTVFKDNILLTLAYAADEKIASTQVDWNRIEKPFEVKITLQPHEIFAFHDDVLASYSGKVTKTTNAHFDWSEGFKSDGYLVGDGVCHLASLMYWVAKDAGLDAYAPIRHDFAHIPDVPREYGVSIYSNPNGKNEGSELQNLYITNNKDKTITFDFDYDGNSLSLKALE